MPSRPASREGAPGTPKAAAGRGPGRGEDPFGWSETDKTTKRRVIAIHVKRLLDNDRKMNIVIRNKDIIRIPEVVAGEFYVAGEVARPGVYSMTGRQITIKMALAAAGNLQGLPDPSPASTYHAVAPTRLLDTRDGTGLSGTFSVHAARTWRVTNR